jgi:peptidyl-prolyl cis-trans isomerase C
MLLAASAVTGCSHDNRQVSYVARVDQAVLTERELVVAPDSLANDRQRTREYINTWITTELLYQEAQRRGLTENEELQRQLEAAKKQLAIAALLDRELYNVDATTLTEGTISAVYKASGDKFFLREDVVKVSFALFSERDAANTFRTRILSGTSWGDAVLQVQRDTLLRSRLRQVADHQYFTQANLYPEELWKLSRTLAKEEVSFVVKTEPGYYVLMVHNVKRQGELPDLAYVRNEIRDRILIEQRRRKYEKLLEDIRARHTVDIRMDFADTTLQTRE